MRIDISTSALSWLSTLGDILGLAVSLRLALLFFLHEPIEYYELTIYVFTLLLIAGLYPNNSYQIGNHSLSLLPLVRTIISNLAVVIFSVILVSLPSSGNDGSQQWSDFPLLSLKILSFWTVISRLLKVSSVNSDTQQSHWLLLGCNDNSLKFCENLLAQNSSAKFVVLASQINAKILSYKNSLEKVKGNQIAASENSPILSKKNHLSVIEDTRNTTTQTLAPAIGIDLFTNDSINFGGYLQDLAKWVPQPWSGVIVTTEAKLSDIEMRQLMQLRLRGIPVYRLPEAYQALWSKLPSSLLEDTWFTFNDGFNLLSNKFSFTLKYMLDITMSGLLLTLLSPLMLIVALAVKLDSPGPVFYSQIRTGLNGKPFSVYKFRSMYQNAEREGVQWTQKYDPRITRVGHWLRKLRIDELPQLWNVLRGEMSIIGPRPERPEFDVQLKQEIPYYDLRYLVKPGITGWAQVLYAYGASVEDAYEKLAYDLYYIQNYSFWLDVVIVFKTIGVVLLGKGQ